LQELVSQGLVLFRAERVSCSSARSSIVLIVSWPASRVGILVIVSARLLRQVAGFRAGLSNKAYLEVRDTNLGRTSARWQESLEGGAAWCRPFGREDRVSRASSTERTKISTTRT